MKCTITAATIIDGRVYIDESQGSCQNQAIDERMCAIFGFQGHINGKMDPFMKPNVNAPLYRVDPDSKSHVDYILNVRGQYDDALMTILCFRMAVMTSGKKRRGRTMIRTNVMMMLMMMMMRMRMMTMLMIMMMMTTFYVDECRF